MAQSLGHAAARQGHDVMFVTQTQLLGSLREAQATGNYERRFQSLIKVPLLIIDDFGLKPLRSPEDEDFHDLIAERYERAATILTSNLDFDEWGEAFAANKMIGAATLDRLRHGAYRVVLDGESYRDPKPVSGRSKPPAGKGGKTPPAECPYASRKASRYAKTLMILMKAAPNLKPGLAAFLLNKNSRQRQNNRVQCSKQIWKKSKVKKTPLRND